jgi:hypothetical protein
MLSPMRKQTILPKVSRVTMGAFSLMRMGALSWDANESSVGKRGGAQHGTHGHTHAVRDVCQRQ